MRGGFGRPSSPASTGGGYGAAVDTRTTGNDDGTFDIVQRAAGSCTRATGDLESLYWREVSASTLGVVRFSGGALRMFGLWPRLLVFEPAIGGRRRISGGMFARHPYGAIAWWADGEEVVVALERFAPRLRGPFFRAERWFHDIVGRRFLRRACGQEA
jgi:hypothetical protein